jgi:thiamine biosynthesis protein ThiS
MRPMMSETVTIQVNGEPREVPKGLNVTQLVAHLGLTANRLAIERNLELLPRGQWATTVVSGGDRLEIVHLVGGG